MRFNNRVIFLCDNFAYNSALGIYENSESKSYEVPCFAMELGITKQVSLFGNYRKDRIVIFLKNGFGKNYTRLKFGDTFYRVVLVRNNAFYLEGDKSNGIN